MTSNRPLPSDLPRYHEGKPEERDRDGSSYPSPEDSLQACYQALEREVTPKFPRGTNPVKAIRRKCLDCCCGQVAEIDNCPVHRCALWPFRSGSNPFRSQRENNNPFQDRGKGE
jgi:hypothetical protein